MSWSNFRSPIKRGLHIEDDDEFEKEEYVHQTLDADRERSKFEQDLDSFIFGGGMSVRGRARASQANQPTQAKGQQAKAATTASKGSTATQKPIPVTQKATTTTQKIQSVTSSRPANTGTRITDKNLEAIGQASRAGQSGTRNTDKALEAIAQASRSRGQTAQSVNQSTIKSSITANKGGAQPKSVVQSEPKKPERKRDTYVEKRTVVVDYSTKTDNSKEVRQVKQVTSTQSNVNSSYSESKNQRADTYGQSSIKKSAQREINSSTTKSIVQHVKQSYDDHVENSYRNPQITINSTLYNQDIPNIIEEEVEVIQRKKAFQTDFTSVREDLFNYALKTMQNHPKYIRKFKKVAQDYEFAEENVANHKGQDIVRPQEINRAMQRRLNDYNFSDTDFPHTAKSLGQSEEQITANVYWKKPEEIANTFEFGKYIDPNDLQPGLMSHPHFISCLSGLAENQANIKRLIEDQFANSNGFYLVRLFINGVWRYVPVDSSIPFANEQQVGVHGTIDTEYELCWAIIEKAYAKHFGSYGIFLKTEKSEYHLRELTGAPVKRVNVSSPDFASTIKDSLSSGKPVLVVPNEKLGQYGLNPNLSYAVIGQTATGLTLRSCFGTLEKSSKIQVSVDGRFQLTQSQVRDLLNRCIVSEVVPGYHTSTIQAMHNRGFYSCFSFRLNKRSHGFFTLSQWDRRMFPKSKNYQYSPVHLVLHKVESNGTILIDTAFTQGDRHLDIEVELPSGEYEIYVAVDWVDQEFPYSLTYYGSTGITFQRKSTTEMPQLISQSLEQVNLDEGTVSQLGRTAKQYFLYHASSNLILITAHNPSERQQVVTLDLSRVKFDHLSLLTSHTNMYHEDGKDKQSIEAARTQALSNPRWTVELEADGCFTWVMAVTESYNAQNPKLYGFK